MKTHQDAALEYLERAATGRIETLDDVMRAQLDALVAVGYILLSLRERT